MGLLYLFTILGRYGSDEDSSDKEIKYSYYHKECATSVTAKIKLQVILVTLGLGGMWHNITISTGSQEKFCNVHGPQFKTSSDMGTVNKFAKFFDITHMQHIIEEDEMYVGARLALSTLIGILQK
jgi:hypothetical protein